MLDLSQVSGSDLWYLIGLIASDGSMSVDGRHINITSKDRDFLEQINQRLCLQLKIGSKARAKEVEKRYFQLQIGSVALYRMLAEIGMTPNKSITMGELKVSRRHFVDFVRGVVDGDGSISRWIHAGNQHEQWSLRIVSASERYAQWLKKEMESYFDVHGALYSVLRKERVNSLYVIKFGKVAAKIVLKRCYYPNALALDRKARQAGACLRSVEGWSRYDEMICRGAGMGRQS